MDQRIFYAPEGSPALDAAVDGLKKRGVTFSNVPTKAVTHLLLPVPCREDVSKLLKKLSLDVTVIGGFLDRPELAGYQKIDLLQDEGYLWKNAQITAHCAVALAASLLPVTLEDCPVLICGWGRIGKCLAQLLKNCGANVTVAARKERDRAALEALGYDTEDTADLELQLAGYRVIFNTVPSPILSRAQLTHCRPDCLKIELASKPGIEGEDTILAGGLPGKYAPESSGKLIARTVLRLCAKKERMI